MQALSLCILSSHPLILFWYPCHSRTEPATHQPIVILHYHCHCQQNIQTMPPQHQTPPPVIFQSELFRSINSAISSEASFRKLKAVQKSFVSHGPLYSTKGSSSVLISLAEKSLSRRAEWNETTETPLIVFQSCDLIQTIYVRVGVWLSLSLWKSFVLHVTTVC